MIQSTNNVHWIQHTDTVYPTLEGTDDYDVVVVGAGLCGVSTAWHLSQSDLKVALIDARGIGHGATGRNAGFILQGTAERYNRAIEQMGHSKARVVHAFSIENHRRMRTLIEEHNIDCEYAQHGSLQLASTPEEETELIESADLLLADGFEAELLYGAELGEPYLSAGFSTGIVLPEDGEIHPVQFVRAIAKMCHQNGVDIYTNSAIQALNTDNGVTLSTANGTLRSEMAILCTNAYLPLLLPEYSNVVHPVRGQMLCTTPQPKIFERPIYADHGFDYWRQRPDGRIVLGGWRNLDPESEVGYDETLHPEIQANMLRFLRRFKGLEQVDIQTQWSGIMGFSSDGLPLIGEVPGQQNLLLGAGFTGHGFGFAWLAGHSLSHMILESTNEFADLCAPKRFL